MEARLSLRLQYLPCTVTGMCLTSSTVTAPSWILQMEPFPSLLQGSKVELHPLTHAQFATFNFVQRLSPKKGASDKNLPPISVSVSKISWVSRPALFRLLLVMFIAATYILKRFVQLFHLWLNKLGSCSGSNSGSGPRLSFAAIGCKRSQCPASSPM